MADFDSICAVQGCTRLRQRRDWCKTHYARFLRHGSPDVLKAPSRPPRDAVERFWTMFQRSDNGCWEWAGADNGLGYGRFGLGRRHVYAHRFAYELLVEPIPEGLVLDHLCRNPRCVNPSHLEPVTQKVNVQRGEQAQRTHCPKGHLYDEANTGRNKTTGGRYCRACARERWAARTKAVA